MMHVAVWVCLFTMAAICGVVLAQVILPPVEDRRSFQRLDPIFPVALMAAAGLVLASRGATFAQLAMTAFAGVALIGCWYADVKKGVIPDVFTLLPLALILGYVVVQKSWLIGIAAVLTGAVFAAAVLLSRGRGMSWGDAKLAAVAGALLGLPWSIGVLGVACFIATAVSVVRDRGTKPIAFAPYIAGSVLIFVAVVPV